MNVSQFVIAGDGWVHVTPCGEFPHSGAGVTQVVDREACDKISAEFNGRRADPNFPGVLVDFDHFSLDTDKSSEAAGWITELEARDTGLWARVRWSDSGLAAVQGGRFRLVSPVFPAPDACEDLGSGRIRPVKLVSVALTNEPNIKGARPIANRKTDVGGQRPDEKSETANEANQTNGEAPKGNVMSGPGAKKFMWLLGDPPKGPHCGDCVSRNGQVKTLLEWLRMPAPKCHCYCRLAEVGKDVPEGYDPTAVTLNLGNRWSDAARAAARESRKANGWGGGGWSDAARAASLAVRRAKAAARQAELTALGGKYSDGTPVIRDLTAGFDDYEPGQTTISDGTAFEVRQAAYAEAFRRWWSGVETTSDNIDKFNEFVAAFGGMAAAAAGASSPAGAASRAFGVDGVGRGSAKARRGALSRTWNGMRDALRRLGAEPVTDEAVVAVERAKAEFRARRTAEGSALADAIRRIDPNAPADLENFALPQLRDYLRRLGGDPGKAAPRDSVPETFDSLRAKYGVPVSKLKSPAKYAPKQSPAEIRESLAAYLMETLGHRPGNVDQNLGDLKAQTAAAARGVARAKEAALSAQREASLAKSVFGESSSEYAKAVKAVEGAMWEFEHATRASDRISGEYLNLKRNIESFLESVREGGPIDWGPAESDYNALLDAARRAAPLANRWKYGWSDAARAASLAVRRAKAAARKAGEAVGRFLDGEIHADGYADESGGKGVRKGACFICGKEGHWARECPSRRMPPKEIAPHLNVDGDLVVDEWLTVMKGTKPEKVAEILKKYKAGVFLDRVIEIDQRIRAAAMRKAAENKELGGTPAQRDKAWRDVLSAWMDGREGDTDLAKPLADLGAEKDKRRKGTKRMKNRMTGTGAAVNRWSDAARAAARASRKANGNYTGWTDAARAASLAVRRGKASARQEALTALGGTYPDGTPVIRDLTAGFGDYEPGQTAISDAAPFEERQRQYEEAFRQWWSGVETTAENIGKFHEFVAAFGGAAAAAAGAYNPAGAASGAFGAKYGGQKPVYDQSGNVVGWAKVGGRPAAARRSAKPAREIYTADPLNAPKTPADLAVRESYGRYLADLKGQHETEMAAKGLDPQGYPFASSNVLPAGAARDAARALGVLHGAYGVGEDGVAIPEALRGEYERGRAEGAKGYDYGIVPPRDRAAVLRGAQAYLSGAVGEDEGYAPDHLNDRYNLADWDSAASWATRNQGKNAVYDPRTTDTRGQYNPASLMRTAMEWFGDAMVRGDRGESDAALSYMGDLLAAVSADRHAAAGAARGGSDSDDEDGPEVDTEMPAYDEDGVEVGGEPFFEDSYADPHARMPWEWLGNRWSDAARAAARASRKANGWGGGGWSDAARAASLAVRRAKAAARKAEEGGRVDGPADLLPLAHPGFGAADDALEDYLKRKRRHEANEARKAADKSRLREEREARRERRNSSLKDKFDAPGLREKFDQPGLREKFEAANERIDRDRLKDKSVKGNAWKPAEGFSVPAKGAVFYYNGNFYDDKGNWVAKAKPSPKSGAVWQNGLWYDAATGKTLGRTVAAS